MRWPHHSCLEMHQSRMLSIHLRGDQCQSLFNRTPDQPGSASGCRRVCTLFRVCSPVPKKHLARKASRSHVQLLSCYLFQSRCAEAGRMPKLSPATTDLGSDAQAAFAFAAMSPQLTHLQRSAPFDLGTCGTFMKCACLPTWHLHARQSQESIRSRDLHSFETVHRAEV